jgi:phosphotransferase system enzyme I (PtsI)
VSETADERLLNGLALSPGLAFGTASHYRDLLQLEQEGGAIPAEEVEREYERIQEAIRTARRDLQATADEVRNTLSDDMANIFRAHDTMLQDPELQEMLRKELEQELLTAEQIIRNVFRRIEQKLRAADSDVVGQRSEDVADLGRRLLSTLLGARDETPEDLHEETVLVAERLLPSDTVFLSRKAVAAVVVASGGSASHAAILTRELGIPAVSQIDDVFKAIPEGRELIVDGLRGRLIVSPAAETAERYRRRQRAEQERLQAARAAADEPAHTAAGERVYVYANVGCAEDARLAAENGAEGIGLYRTEFLYIARQALPPTDEVRAALRKAIEPFAERPVTIRLIDIGADKKLPFLKPLLEPNPALGVRGVRLLRVADDVLRAQLEAVLGLAECCQLRLLVPMVTLPEDMAAVREAAEDVASGMGLASLPPIGAMIETPAAALCAADLADGADFFSIGTNDLTQYTMAAGRENQHVARYFRQDHPAILRLLRLVRDAVPEMPLEICGELAAEEDAVGALLELGIRHLSVAPLQIPLVKQAVRQADGSASA